MVNKGKQCWLSLIKTTLCQNIVGTQYWNNWEVAFLNNRKTKCVVYEVIEDNISKKVKISQLRWEDKFWKELKANEISRWLQQINKSESKNKKFSNKLRTYCKFKTEWGFENYLKVLKKPERTSLLKFRIGISPLRIETGRYEHGKRLPPEERICKCCDLMQVEDELHFFSECTLYTEERAKLHGKLKQCNVRFDSMYGEQLFVECMKARERPIIEAVADFVFRAFSKRGCKLCK